MVITSAQATQFVAEGAVTLNTPFTSDQVAAASAAIDLLLPHKEADDGEPHRYRFSATCNFYDPAFLDLLQHPFLETVAKTVLRADRVVFLQAAAIVVYPQPEGPFTFDQHIDLQYTHSDLEASPRRIVCTFFLWLSDVTATRSPLMYRPGSHRQLAKHWQQQPELQGCLPRVQGMRQSDLPDLPFSEAQPLLARAGQGTVLTTAMVHGASVNLDEHPRKALVVTFSADSVTVVLPKAQAEAKAAFEARLGALLRIERRHLLRSDKTQ
jgi:hypothetical protein